MTEEINYKNNPLNGVGLKSMVSQLVEHYGFEILYAYLNLNSFKNNPSIGSSITFLKKTDWAREKVEDFYLYQFKSLPKPNYEQLQVPPRDRIIPDEQKPGEPAQLSVEDGERLQGERKERSERHDRKKTTAPIQLNFITQKSANKILQKPSKIKLEKLTLGETGSKNLSRCKQASNDYFFARTYSTNE